MDGKANRKGASSAKRLTVTVEVDTLDCPICSEPLRPPIFQCYYVGHLICSSCVDKHFDNNCHLCASKTAFNRCFGMEHVIQSVKVPCSNAMYGCTEMVTYYQKEEHEKTCAALECFCPVSCCTFVGPTEELLDHLTTEHQIRSTTLTDSDTDSLHLLPGLHVLRRNGTSYFFLFSLSLLPVGHAISVVCVQPKVTEPKFMCNMRYDCFTTGSSESSSCLVRSSSLSDGYPTGYDLILTKGKFPHDRKSILLRITIHQALSVGGSCLQGKGLALAPQQNTPLEIYYSDVSDDDEDDDGIPSRTTQQASCCWYRRVLLAMDSCNFNKGRVEARREGENSGKMLTVTMEVDTLDCPICFEPLRSPIFQCHLGHYICSFCHGKRLDDKCHLCSTKNPFTRCFWMEYFVQSVMIPCSGAMYGCTEKITYYKKEEHEKTCATLGCFCPVSCCTFVGPPKALLDHLATKHQIPSKTLPDSDTESIYLKPGLHVLRRNGACYFFLFSLSVLPVGHAISVVCVQPKVTEPKFTCNMRYDCFTTGFSESSSCHIRSSSLSDGYPTGYDLILAKGKFPDDRKSILLRVTIHQALCVSRPHPRGNSPTLFDFCSDDDDYIHARSIRALEIDRAFERAHMIPGWSPDDIP